MVVLFGIVVIAICAIAVAIAYNLLIKRRQLANNGWSDIDVQLKRRADLIPSLVQTVQGYARHERELFEDVTTKRNAALAAADHPAQRGAAESALSKPVSRLIAVAEDYPELKASDNFLALQRQLAETEDKIEMARRFYNGAVRELNTLIQSVPINVLAQSTGFQTRDYFEIDIAARAVPSVQVADEA